MTSRTVASPTSQIDSDIRKITQSSLPAFALSALFIGSALRRPDLTRRTFTPPFVFRFGFGAIFAGGGYMLASGDIPNGSGVMTAWSMSYIVLEQFARGLEKKERLPRSGISLVLCGASLASAALYGTEYFAFNDYDD